MDSFLFDQPKLRCVFKQTEFACVACIVHLCHGPPHSSPGPLRHCSTPQEARPDPNWQEVREVEVEEVEHQGGKTRPTASEGAKRERSTQAHMLDNTVVEPCSGFNSWPMI